jgi:hypothetical protein
MLSQRHLIIRFGDGYGYGNASHMFIADNVLYSYGYHHPLAIRIHSDLFILNADKVSVATTHQYHKTTWLPGVSARFSLLNHVINMPNTEKMNIIDYESPYSLLFSVDNHTYLADRDNIQYFLVELPYPVTTIKDAFDSLKPFPVTQAESIGIEVVRQGEWFFVKTAIPPKVYRKWQWKTLPLPRETSHRHSHVCKHCCIEGTIYATGMVRHVSITGKATREHKALRLGKAIYAVYKNTAIRAWTTPSPHVYD